MLRAFRREIERSSWVVQLVVWPIYFALWLITELLRGVLWVLAELYHQAQHGLQTLIRRHFWWITGVGALMVIYLGAPELLGPLLQLGVTVVILFLVARGGWYALFPRKKKRNDHH